MRARVVDLIHDDAKRDAFAEAAWASMQGRTWPVLCEQLMGHYERAVNVQRRRRGELARRFLDMPGTLAGRAGRVFG